MNSKIVIGLLLAVLSASVAFYLFLFEPALDRSDAVLEVFKFILFTCAVSGVLLFYKSIDAHYRNREGDREAVDEFRRNFLRAYHNIKMVRREFRFLTRVENGRLIVPDTDKFFEAYKILNDSYVEFELLRKSITADTGPFSKIRDQISSDMRAVDKYIRKIMLELEALNFSDEDGFDLSSVGLFHAFLYEDGNPVHVAASKSLDKYLVYHASS
ncbi:hypothetical protein JI664_15720 [Rhodobacter sp. NTK016B]|uniref:hypothetical protein n=1 Tax=Rhodobacter sp. NTK016B TaxID=2759676 RepID=UPI001A8ED4D6|nr:hypothetical protein [Rhodobacter sp. NTK016B]MBN8293422.1 hypothetical protein [Rhodobacter sp. NTK016B]